MKLITVPDNLIIICYFNGNGYFYFIVLNTNDPPGVHPVDNMRLFGVSNSNPNRNLFNVCRVYNVFKIVVSREV